MVSTIPPVVRYMILCEEVLIDPGNPGKLSAVGLITVVKWPKQGVSGICLNQLVVLLVLTGGRGTGFGRIVCTNEETGQRVFRSGDRAITFAGTDPALPYGVTF